MAGLSPCHLRPHRAGNALHSASTYQTLELATARALLAECGWLCKTPEGFRESILAQSQLRSFSAGETIYAEGDPSEGLYGLAAGTLGIELSGPTRPPGFAYLTGKGFWIGAHTLVLGPGRQVGLVALTPCHVLHLSGSAFHVIARREPEAWRWLSVLPLMQNAVAFGVLEDLLIRSPKRRCAAILLRLAGCRGPFAGDTPEEIFVTEEVLAEMANLSRTSVGDVLRDLEAQEFISRRYGRISIDRDKLTALISPG